MWQQLVSSCDRQWCYLVMVIVRGDSEAGCAGTNDGCETRAAHLRWRKAIVAVFSHHDQVECV